MTKMRKVLLTIEVNTVLTAEELKTLQALVFGRMRSDSYAKEQRMTIKRHMPAGMNHDVRGTLEQVQVNVVKEKKSKKPRASKKSEPKAVAAAS